ncbi:MAG: arsenosugar biosynthesis radical SAM protein ArsS [Planctomycetes bacterium]|nr:arsenosugar biosynthesis radical SAM protein ArsS [Planctomycetota bacterium]
MTQISLGEFDQRVEAACDRPLRARSIDTIQVNIGLTCDLACRHCHVESSPKRTEQMDWPTMLLVLQAAKRAGVKTLDITGGAPEMNPYFRRFVTILRGADFDVLVRTNLTIMHRDGYTDLPEFYRDQRVALVASLPCYLPKNVDRQRGLRVYDKSVHVIRRLNSVGYGSEPDLTLTLVYNPTGPSLPPEQSGLECDYRRELQCGFGISFTRLYTITNMPIGRFLHDLRRDGHDERYLQLLRESFNPATIDGLMCRRQIHVSWDGTLHDCDFNYALGLPIRMGIPRNIGDFDAGKLMDRRIVFGEHCFGCTAGAGSSCGGTIA